MFNKRAFEQRHQEKVMEQFMKKIMCIETKVGMEIKAQGWKYVKTASRTVIFTFGEVTFSRKCYTDGNTYRYPVDEELGLSSYTRFSMELLLQIAELATKMPYREVAKTFNLLKGIYITKDTVLKAVNLASKYYKEKEEYRFYQEKQPIEKETISLLYIEGDGIQIKTNQKGEHRADLAHFVIHQGCQEEYKGWNQLMDKHEIISANNRQAREAVMDYVYNHYKTDENTLIITNSDMGNGYTPYVFKELVASFSCQHIHFWDRYHLNEKVKEFFKRYDPVLYERFVHALQVHSKKEARLVLETMEAMLEGEEETARFEKFSKKILREFQYTKSPKHYGFSGEGIGVMESQQSKIANRMKKRGMYWSVSGGETMGKLIIDVRKGQLRELFFGK